MSKHTRESVNKTLQKMLQDFEDEVRNEPGMSEETRARLRRLLDANR